MASDAYIKFGERDELGDNGLPLPLIEGDSSDTEHFWWTELRGYDFDIRAGERKREGDAEPDPERSRPTLGDVIIKKKVDWGSADLFRKCCEAAEATVKRSDDGKGKGLLDKVTVEICRRSGVASEGRLPFLTVTYSNVYVISYTVDISDPDPMETIILKCEKVEFEYIQTDPQTGGRMKGGSKKATGMVQHKQPVQLGIAAASSSAIPSVAAPATATATAAAAAAIAATATAGAPGANGSTVAGAPSTDAQVNSNFPGVWQGTGFGILPD